NEELINVYTAVRDCADEVIARLADHRAQHGREHFYAVRDLPYSPGPAGASRTIYLNQTCYNGLFRVNRLGRFNVPMGRHKNPRIYDAGNLRRASAALQGVTLLCQDFRVTIDETARGLIYADPPYVPVSATASFTSYARDGFGIADHQALADCLRAAGR